VRKILDWGNCVGICTDETASMTGYCLGVVEKIKDTAHKEMLFRNIRNT